MSDKPMLSSVPVLVSDFDGTMTLRDFYQLAQERLVPPDTPDYWGDYLAGRLTHFEALRRIFATIRADEADVWTTALCMELDPDLGLAIQRLRAAGWEITVASAGCDWYIRRLLAMAGAQVTVYANPGEYSPQNGLQMQLPVNSPYYSEQTGINKEAVMRDAVASHRCAAFAGDGRPDLPAALLAPPERRFARGWLAEYLQGENIPFHTFSRWSEIADVLLEGDGVCR